MVSKKEGALVCRQEGRGHSLLPQRKRLTGGEVRFDLGDCPGQRNGLQLLRPGEVGPGSTPLLGLSLVAAKGMGTREASLLNPACARGPLT